MKRFFLFAAMLASAASAFSQVYITEFMYRGVDRSVFTNEAVFTQRFVELTNFGPVAVNISQWQIRNNGNYDIYNLSSFGLIAPGESVIVTNFNYSSGFRETWTGFNTEVPVQWGSLSMGNNDFIRLYNQNNALVDQLDFAFASGQALGVSAVTTFENLGQNNFAGWFLSNDNSKAPDLTNLTSVYGDIGNPGYLNFAYTPVPEPASAAALLGLLALGAASLRRRR